MTAYEPSGKEVLGVDDDDDDDQTDECSVPAVE